MESIPLTMRPLEVINEMLEEITGYSDKRKSNYNIELSKEEVEAMRLKNVKGLDQVEAAKKMKTSQSTFQRILISAYKKVSQALVEGKAIKILKK